MATKKNDLSKQQAKEVQAILKQFGISGGAYEDLIHQAIVYDWSPQRFVVALTRSKEFDQQFPGLFQGGHLNDFLLGKQGAPLSPTTLGQAISNYRTLWQSYESAGAPSGYGNLNKQQVATLIKNEVSPDEWGQRAFAVKQVKKNPEAFAEWQKQAKLAGVGDLNIFKAAAGLADQKFYDIYEATRFQTLGANLGFSSEEARQIAKALPNTTAQGKSTGIADVGALLNQLRQQFANIGPDLQRYGITPVELAKFIANPNADKTGLGHIIQQMVADKRAAQAYQSGSRASQGTGGGIALYPDEGAASYG